MVEPKIGALHVWLRASILSFSCLTSLHCVMLCNRMWHAEISLTNTVFSETGLLPWCSGQELDVYCLVFLERLPSLEATLWGKFLPAYPDGKGQWWHLEKFLFKDSWGKKPRALGKGWRRKGGCQERERVVPAEPSWAVQIQCHRLALRNENRPVACQKMSCGSTLTSPIFSCKDSYEFSSFFLRWSKALRLLCHEHEMVLIGDCSQIIQGLNLCLSGNPILSCWGFLFMNLKSTHFHAGQAIAPLLHYISTSEQEKGGKRKG